MKIKIKRYLYAFGVSIFLLVVARPISAAPRAEDIVYVVQPGDTLTYVAFKYGVSVEALARLNKIPDVNQIHPDLQLLIPHLESPALPNESLATASLNKGLSSSTTETLPVLKPGRAAIRVRPNEPRK
jgi:LysM repeat protein